MRDELSDLEAMLDRVIVCLDRKGAPRQTRALLVEARRLSNLVRNWRTIAPTNEARAQMIERVEQLLSAARTAAVDEKPPGGDVQVAPSKEPQVAPSNEPCAEPAKEPKRLQTLPDLDISGIADLFPGRSLDDAPLGGGRPSRPSRPSPVADEPDSSDSRDATPNAPRVGRTKIAVRPCQLPKDLDARLILLNEPYSERAEAYRALRRRLATAPVTPAEARGGAAPRQSSPKQSEGPLRAIAIESAEPGEGKTTCAVNLALAFRETANEKVLLIEANLRAPSLAKLFGFTPPACFVRQMLQHRDTTKAVWTVAEPFEPLHLLAVDPKTKAPPLLDPVAFANALEQLLDAGYDHVIIDGPPVVGTSDANLVADAACGVVVVARMKKSKRATVQKAILQLKPATILGVVLLEP